METALKQGSLTHAVLAVQALWRELVNPPAPWIPQNPAAAAPSPYLFPHPEQSPPTPTPTDCPHDPLRILSLNTWNSFLIGGPDRTARADLVLNHLANDAAARAAAAASNHVALGGGSGSARKNVEGTIGTIGMTTSSTYGDDKGLMLDVDVDVDVVVLQELFTLGYGSSNGCSSEQAIRMAEGQNLVRSFVCLFGEGAHARSGVAEASGMAQKSY